MARDVSAPCRVLIGGFGRPAQRDLDFGHQLVSYLGELEWPAGVVAEDLSYAAPLVLHRLQELRPARVVLMGAVPRGRDEPGTIRRYRLDPTPPSAGEVRQLVEESVGGMADLDHTLAVARHWGGLPADTVIVEIEPADCSFGLGFSEELARCFDPVLAILREEAGAPETVIDDDSMLELAMIESGHGAATARSAPSTRTSDAPKEVEGRGGIVAMADYARHHQQARQLERHRARGSVVSQVEHAGLEVAARSRPWSIGLESGGDWYDTIPLEGGVVGVVMGDVPGRGVEATALKSDVAMALRAYAELHGHSPSRVLRSLDQLVGATGIGEMTTLVYLTLDPASGQVRLSSAGHCPPLVVDAGGSAAFIEAGRSLPLGTFADGDRPEAVFSLPMGSALVLFTDGLVEGRRRPITDGLAQLRRAVANGPRPLDGLCDHVLSVCLNGASRDDDVSLLALRRLP